MRANKVADSTLAAEPETELEPKPGHVLGEPVAFADCIAEEALLRHILLHATTHTDLLSFASRCARVCRDWHRVVSDSPAYFSAGLCESGSPDTPLAWCRQEFLRLLSALVRDNEQVAAASHATFLLWGIPRRGLCGDDDRKDSKEQANASCSTTDATSRSVSPDVFLYEDAWRTVGMVVESMGKAPEEIALVNCSLAPTMLVHLEPGMRRTAAEGLTSLNVSNNSSLGNAGIALLAEYLPETLTDLSFYKTGCGNRGMVAMAQRIGTLRRLERLCCSDNTVGLDGWAALGVALREAPCLVELTASRCCMGSDGALALIVPSGRRACAPSLRRLDLRSNNIGEAAADTLQTAWRVRIDGLMLMQAMAGLAL
jgi:hypothetical protein